MHKYEVKSTNQGNVLFKDGNEAFCPFQQPLPTQGISGVGLMRMPCSTNCPMAYLEEESNEVHEVTTGETLIVKPLLRRVSYVTTCGCKENRYEVMMTVNQNAGI